MNLSLSGKTALICGSTQGIGWATAKQLADQGANCVLFARNEVTLHRLCILLSREYSIKANYLVGDFNNPEQVGKTLESYLEENRIDIIINNSGGPPGGAITEAKPEDFLLAIHRHLLSSQAIVKACLPKMKDKGFGRIINIVSTSVYEPIPGLGVSNTTRGAMAGWAKTLSLELAGDGITVNNVLPGATWTERLKQIIQAKADKQGVDFDIVKKQFLKEIPANRFAEPEETANATGFLASEAAAYISGVSLPVDGGRMKSI